MKPDTNLAPTSGASQAGQPPAFPLTAGSPARGLWERSNDIVICPHCGASYQPDSEDCSEEVRKETCFTCKKEYEVWQEFVVWHCTGANAADEQRRGKDV